MKHYNIYLRKDGRWEGRISTGMRDGKRKYKSFFGGTREIVAAKMDAYRSEQEYCTDSALTVGELFGE